MRTHTVALVPLRSPGAGKTRLASALGPEQRAALAQAMLCDVVHALTDAIDRIVVAAGGPGAAAAATALELDVVVDPPGPGGLDGALRAAASRLGPVDELLVVAADLPRLTADDVTAVLGVPAAVVVAPTHDGGTGGLLRRPPGVIPTAYGPGSAARHLAAARTAGVTVTTVTGTGFAADVDTTDDLAGLVEGTVGPATARWLRQVGQQLPLPGAS